MADSKPDSTHRVYSNPLGRVRMIVVTVS